jgi:FkbM family methyltransferase
MSDSQFVRFLDNAKGKESAMTPRLFDLMYKAWTYLLAGLERPWELPSIAWLVGSRRVHLGELVRLNRYKGWLEESGITTVVDIGAHTGQFASAVRAILPHAYIYSFEPLPDCCQQLKRRMSRYGRFQVFCTALGDQRGKTAFWRSAFPKSSSVLPMSDAHKTAFPWTAKCTPVDVQMNMLDDYIDEIDFVPQVLLKVDVQGYELNVLQGAVRALEHINYLLVETSFCPLYEGSALFHDVYCFLHERGFTYAGNLDQLVSLQNSTILQADALFTRQE